MAHSQGAGPLESEDYCLIVVAADLPFRHLNFHLFLLYLLIIFIAARTGHGHQAGLIVTPHTPCSTTVKRHADTGWSIAASSADSAPLVTRSRGKAAFLLQGCSFASCRHSPPACYLNFPLRIGLFRITSRTSARIGRLHALSVHKSR